MPGSGVKSELQIKDPNCLDQVGIQRCNSQEWPWQTKPKKGQFMNFSQGHSRTKVQCESCLFSLGKNTRIHKNGRNS